MPNIFKLTISTVIALILMESNFCQEKSTYSYFLNLAEIYPDSSIKMLEENDSVKSKLSFEDHCFLLAKSYQNKGKFEKSINIVTICNHMGNYLNDSDKFYLISMLNAENFRVTNQYENALPILINANQYYTSKKDTVQSISSAARLMEFYRTIKDFSSAEDLARVCKKSISEYNLYPDDLKAYFYNRLAAIYVEQNKYLDSAILLTQQVLAITKRTNNLELEASSSNELAYLYFNLGRDSALHYFNHSKEIYEQLKYNRYLVNVEINLARYFLFNGKLTRAMQEIESAISTSKSYDWNTVLEDAQEMKSRILFKMGLFEEAYQLSRQAWMKRLKTLEKLHVEEVAEINAKYKVEQSSQKIKETQKEIERLNTLSRVHELENNQMFYGLASTLLIIIIMVFFYFRINIKNVELGKSRDLLSKTNLELEKLIEVKESLLKEVNHRVKNNLSVLSGLLILQQKNIQNEEAIHALENSQRRITSISLIHESLYQLDDMSKVNFQEYLERLCFFIKSSFGQDLTNVEIEIKCSDLVVDLETSIPLAMIINELVTNSFKYAFEGIENPLIGIVYSKKNNLLKIFDNGPGNSNTKNTSLGLQLVDIFSEQINAQYSSKSEDCHFVNTIKFSNAS